MCKELPQEVSCPEHPADQANLQFEAEGKGRWVLPDALHCCPAAAQRPWRQARDREHPSMHGAGFRASGALQQGEARAQQQRLVLRDDKVLVLVHKHLAGVGHQARVVVHRKGCGGALGRRKAPVLGQPGAQRVGQVLHTGLLVWSLEPNG